ncbi:MAG: ABC transporter permease [Candidatus Diapherotrites archaeon]|jgi:ABC-type multidrug transport system permease subunit|uniref:ABC transporter permease n=1 Tax=Candidatus Iainarchaeum sp. TaxID=3101447 RepID=A0A8T5GG97_9ARCH|nr:ABC transporter permease [Candidatus Diapherotrites archaeon]
MKLIEIIWKEISLVKSQKIAILLIVLLPFIAISLLVAAFTGTDMQQMGGINVGVVNELEFDANLIGQVAEMKEINLIEYLDENKMRSAIRRKEIIVGLKISGKGEYSQKKIDMIYDNSNLMSSKLFLELAKAIIQRVTVQTAQTQLSEVWITLTDLGKNLDDELNQISEFKKMLADAETDLDDLENKLSALDLDEIELIVADQKDNINSFDGELTSFENDVADFKTSFYAFKSDYEDLKTELDSYESTLETIPGEMSLAINSLDESITYLKNLEQSIPLNQDLSDTITSLEERKSQMQDWNNTISEVLVLINEIQDEESNLNTTITETESYFDEIDAAAIEVSSALSESSSDIDAVNEKLSVFKESISEVEELIFEARRSKSEIESKLNASDSLLSSFSNELIEFSKIDPKVLAKPVIFYEAGVFDVNPKGILTANATAIVLIMTCLLLTSMSVITERNQKSALRMGLSPTNKVTFVVGGVLGQLVIALVEAMIIFIVAAIGFGVDILPVFGELFIATILIALSFISIGLLVTFFTKNQSTAILLSLLVIVPLLFISGVIIPLDFMTPLIQVFSSFMPLTIANNLLIGVLVRGISLTEMLFEVGVLVSIIVAVIIITLLKKESY